LIRRQSIGVRATVLFVFFVFAIVLIYASVVRFNIDKPEIDNLPNVGQMAPDFTLKQLDGTSLSLSSLRGKTVLLTFWGTYSGNSRAEISALQQVYEKWKGKGVVIVGVDIGEDPITISGFFASHPATFPVVIDKSRDVTLNTYKIQPIPATFLIDSSGRIRERAVEEMSAETLDQWLVKLGVGA